MDSGAEAIAVLIQVEFVALRGLRMIFAREDDACVNAAGLALGAPESY